MLKNIINLNSEYYSKARAANFLAKSTPFYLSTNHFSPIKCACNLYYVKCSRSCTACP